MRFAVYATAALAALLAQAAHAGEFKVGSADGTEISGFADLPAQPARLTVVFVPGTGLFDRDAPFGKSGTLRDLVFKDLSARMVARGGATVRYDVRGIRYGMPPDQMVDLKLLAGRTTQNMREDVAAVYDWARSPGGTGTRCTVFFVHSEGMIHVARLAAAGAPAPASIIGVGAAMEGPAATLRWQLTGRDADSLEMMDADRNGIVTNDEVKANLSRTPSGAHAYWSPSCILPVNGPPPTLPKSAPSRPSSTRSTSRRLWLTQTPTPTPRQRRPSPPTSGGRAGSSMTSRPALALRRGECL